MSTVDIVKKMDEAHQKVKDFSDLLESIETFSSIRASHVTYR